MENIHMQYYFIYRDAIIKNESTCLTTGEWWKSFTYFLMADSKHYESERVSDYNVLLNKKYKKYENLYFRENN